MQEQETIMAEVLKYNKGFAHPEKWIEYAIAHEFKKTKAEKLEECPDCKGRSFRFIGQFVYYSTLVNLLECSACGLIFTDTRIASEIISAHFEQAYKDEEYFEFKRNRIFEQIVRVASEVAPQGGRVLDVGGAKGHLLAALKKSRPDLHLVLNDLSKSSCDHARLTYNLETILGGLNELEQISSRFDVIILSDVIYYEPELCRLWNALARLVSKGGTVILRVPNKTALIRFWQLLVHAITPFAKKEMQDTIKFFNPEHLYIFSRGYLLKRLKVIGFQEIFYKPSELLVKESSVWLSALLFSVCNVIWIVSCKRLIITPSLLIICKNNFSEKS